MGLLDNIAIQSTESVETICSEKFAVIGLAGEFPQSKNVEDFFNHLLKGKDFITTFPEKRKAHLEKFDEEIDGSKEYKQNYRLAAYLEDISSFDHSLFNINEAEARLMDPKQRLLLQTAYRAFEDGGMLDELEGSQTGVFIGSSDLLNYSYFDLIKQLRPDLVDLSSSGNMNPMLSSRISYYFNLKGPSIVVDTACSSSMIALDQACNSISAGECETALVGGVHLLMYPKESNLELGIESKDMKTRTFDDSASGTGVGEGVGAIVIKRLEDAVDNHDKIYCVITGVAANQDGASIGITAPDREAQSQLQTSLWDKVNIDIEKTVYVEAHGTATHLGDNVELSALTESFSKQTDKKQFCGIGSVKSNLGHTIDASGIISLIKTIMIVSKKIIPPTINFEYPNRNIFFEDSPFFIVDKPNIITEKNFYCLINSFGLSGTNCHLILEPYHNPKRLPLNLDQKILPFVVMGKTNKNLYDNMQRFKNFLEMNEFSNLDFYNLSWSMNKKQKLPKAIVFFASSKKTLLEELTGSLTDSFELNEDVRAEGHDLVDAKIADYFFYNRRIPLSFYMDVKPSKVTTPTINFELKDFWLEGKENFVRRSKTSSEVICDILIESFGYENVKPNSEIASFDMDSIFVLKFFSLIDELYPQAIEIADIYSSQTIAELSKKVESFGVNENRKAENTSVYKAAYKNNDIAIVGIDLKVGQAQNKEEFFNQLIQGKDFVREFPKNRVKDALKFLDGLAQKRPVFSKGNYFEAVDQFDYKKFGIPYTEAELMDPNHRMMLESVYSAICDYGKSMEEIKGQNWGTFIGYGQDYLFNYGHYISKQDSSKVGLSNTGNLSAMISGRIAYQFDLNGPALTIDTSCSSSLACIIEAVKSLSNNECKTAIVGSVKLNFCPIEAGENNIGIISKNKKTQAFDNAASGTSIGEGVVSLILKPLEKAVTEADTIYGVIKGCALNHDGRTNGLTYPNATAQAKVIQAAWEKANIDVRNRAIYIETHGTGTLIGDPIEITGINRAFNGLKEHQQIGIGSIKNNIGHLFEASGLFSVVKGVMALKKGIIPKTINFEFPNRNILFENSLVYVNDRNYGIEKDTDLAIGISSFGFSGTNAHVVVEGYHQKIGRQPLLSDLIESRCWFEKKDNIDFDVPLSHEQLVSNIFKKTFGLNEIAQENDLFELGGDSITALSIVSELNKRLNIAISVTEIMTHPAVKDLVQLVKSKIKGRSNEVIDNRIPIAEKHRYYDATPQQLRMFKMSQNRKMKTGLNVNIALKIKGKLDGVKMEQALNDIVKRHETLRTSFVLKSEKLKQKINNYSPITLTHKKITDEKKLVREKASFVREFDLLKQPLYRAELITENDATHYFLFDIHHILFEFHSMSLFLNELFSLYNGAEIPENRLHYKDFSEWYLSDSLNKTEQSQYWLKKMDDCPDHIKFSDEEEFDNNTIKMTYLSIPVELSKKLSQFASNYKVSMFSILLSAYFLIMSEKTQAEDMIVGIPVSGRHYPGVEKVMGLFRNSLPIRAKIKQSDSLLEVIKGVYTNCLEAMDHQDFQTYEIEAALGLNKSLFNTYFILQESVEASNFELGNLEVSTELIRKNGMFDLKWEFVNQDGVFDAVIEYRDELITDNDIKEYKKLYLSVLKKIVGQL